jgi:histidine triad (HIT) family protein
MSDCIFCGIAAGTMGAERVHEDERTVAFLDIFPACDGHVLVIPRAHAADVHEISEDDVAAAASVAKRLAGRAVSGLGADGVTIMQSNGAAAWQTVFHYHVHVIPRYRDDPLVLPWRPGEAPADPADLVNISRSYFPD